jgi:hypothetical protein
VFVKRKNLHSRKNCYQLFFVTFVSVADYRESDNSPQSTSNDVSARVLSAECDLSVASSTNAIDGSTKSTVRAPSDPVTITEDIFYEIFKASTRIAWLNISKDPVHSLTRSKYGK